MTFSIELTKSVNGIAFGTSRSVVRNAFGSDYTEFKKTPLSQNTTDAYPSFHVYYTPDDRLEAIEFFDNAEIIISGQAFSWEYAKAKKWMLGIDPAAVIDDDGITSAVYGIGLYSPDGIVEGVLFAESSYYK